MMLITPDQVRMARSLLRWRQADLAKRAGLSRATIVEFESGRLNPRASTMRAMVEAFEQEGIEFAESGMRRAVSI